MTTIPDDDDDDNNINKHLDTREVSIRSTLVSIQIDTTDHPNNNCSRIPTHDRQ